MNPDKQVAEFVDWRPPAFIASQNGFTSTSAVREVASAKTRFVPGAVPFSPCAAYAFASFSACLDDPSWACSDADRMPSSVP